jgi:hypothetical protein
MLGSSVEAAFRGPFLALFGDEAAGMRAVTKGDGEHLVGRGHLQVERQMRFGREAVDIGIADVAAVFTQMRRDAVGACLGSDACGTDRIGMRPAPGVTDRRDVVDIYAETEVLPLRHS